MLRSACLYALGFSLATHASAADFSVTTAADSGAGSLRAAITNANAALGADRITFDIPTSDAGFQPATAHWRIDVTTVPLPTASESLEIDGYTQPGAVENTATPNQGGSNAVLKIELRNQLGNNVNGLESNGNFFFTPLVIRGLAINGFNAQVVLNGGTAQRIEGCFLGTTIDGGAAATSVNNNRIGVRVQGPGPFVIGGLNAAARNVISGDSSGIGFFGNADGVRIQGNLIGTDASGSVAISPRATGIQFGDVRNLTIGGSDPGARNVISGNGFFGIYLFSSSAAGPGSRILGNIIGADATGQRPLGNGFNPFSPSQRVPNVTLFGGAGCAVQVGGEGPGEANLIGYAGSAGIAIDTCMGARAQHNRFIGNSTVPIDLHSGGGFVDATPNDPGDADVGGNRLQNFPELVLSDGFAPIGGNTSTVRYRVDTATANATYPLRVEFFRAGCGGGPVTLHGSTAYLAADAQLEVETIVSSADGGNLLPLVAVAVDADGNVSEVSPVIGEVIFQDGFGDEATPAARTRCN